MFVYPFGVSSDGNVFGWYFWFVLGSYSISPNIFFLIWQCEAELMNEWEDSEAELTRFYLALHGYSTSSGRRGWAD